MTQQDLSVTEALELILASVSVLDTEHVPLSESLHRMIAQSVVARDSLPPFDNSAMDGYALRAEDISTADKENPTRLRVIGDIPAGTWPDVHLTTGTAARITTGAPIPAGTTAVIPVEDTSEPWRDPDRPLPTEIAIYRAVSVGNAIRPQGDDIVAGETILTAGHRIRPQEMSVLASLGVSQVPVVRRPRVAILSTGDELVPVEEALTPGKIRNSNSYGLIGHLLALGVEPIRLGVAKDTAASVQGKLQAAVDARADLIISSAGVSVGAYDVVKTVLDQGGNVNFWRVRMRPGKPLAFGTYQSIPYIGLPGNPVSSLVSFERFARPTILKLGGHSDVERPRLPVVLTEDVFSDGRESYIRVTLDQTSNPMTATPTGEQGSHMITSLVKAEALLIIPEGIKKAPAGTRLMAFLID